MKRYRYGMRHTWITALRPGILQPVFHQEVTPGDIWSGKSTALFRLAPLDVPSFTQFKIDVGVYFVPHRITWDEFEGVITQEDTATPWPSVVHSWDGVANSNALSIQLGMGQNSITGIENVNALPIRAYNKIRNEFYKVQDFDSDIPLDTNAVVRVNHRAADYYAGSTQEIQQTAEVTVDVSGGQLSLNELRDARNLQRFRERKARFGTRYFDHLRAMGANPKESVLDRPEYVARARTMLNVSEVVALASSASEETGEYRGHGIASMRLNMRPRRFQEHGTLMALAVARPRNQYLHRLDKMYLDLDAGSSVMDASSLYSPEYAADQMQGLRAIEIATDGSSATDILGYLPRYQWLRKARDVIAGDMLYPAQRSWTTAKNVGTTPSALNVYQVDDPLHIFQDQGANAPKVFTYFDHRIAKRSIIRPEQR